MSYYANHMLGSIVPEHNKSAIRDIPALSSAIESSSISPPNEEELEELFDYPEIPEATESALIEPYDEMSPFAGEDDVYNPIVDKVIEGGIETIAFYKSFRDVNRKPLQGYWGIFFIKSRVASLVGDLHVDTNATLDESITSTTRFLYGHEIYHYKVDAICLQQEAISRLSIYRPYRRLTRSVSAKYWWEESIANYYGLSVLKPNGDYRPAAAQELIQFYTTLVASSPGAYANGVDGNVLQKSGPKGLMISQIIQSLNTIYGPHQLGLFSNILHNPLLLDGYKNTSRDDRYLAPELGLKNCPVYWLSWTTGGSVVPFRGAAIPINEMKRGFIETYLGGCPEKSTDHEFYRIDNGAKVKVPNPHHKEVMTHEFKNIVRKAGLQVVEFHKERARTKKWSLYSPRENKLPPIN